MLTKMVDGVEVVLSDAEETAMRAAWDAEDALAPARIAAVQRVASDEVDRASCIGDSAIMALVNQTRAEWVTWASTNFPSLTAAEKQRLGVLFWVVAIGVRRTVRITG